MILGLNKDFSPCTDATLGFFTRPMVIKLGMLSKASSGSEQEAKPKEGINQKV